jgi:hypothetical protein
MRTRRGFLFGIWICLGFGVITAWADLPSREWTDPLTGSSWSFVSPGLNWQHAVDACDSAGARLPTREDFWGAQPRLMGSSLTYYLRQCVARAWTSEVWPDVCAQSWAVWTNAGGASAVIQEAALPVFCVSP